MAAVPADRLRAGWRGSLVHALVVARRHRALELRDEHGLLADAARHDPYGLRSHALPRGREGEHEARGARAGGTRLPHAVAERAAHVAHDLSHGQRPEDP